MKINKELSKFIESEIKQNNLLFFETIKYFNFNVLKKKNRAICNLHQINDVRQINSFLAKVNSSLIDGGFYIGCVETLQQRAERLKFKYGNIRYKLLYPIDFLYKRVMPKLPILKNIYLIINRGHNKALSFAEILGRFVFCGFKIVKTTNINNKLYFIVKKHKEKKYKKNEKSYGILLKLNRIGINGKIITIYKLRTMHPYSEFLQDYIVKHNKLELSGKIKNDYRKTRWGRVLRKFWIDEIPMIVNFFKGDLKLFGVRPISEGFFNKYPEELQKKRIQFKPGLVPPYYSDLPKNWNEIIESEKKYLNLYEKNPISTDIKYFFKALYNIILKGNRSS